MRQDASHPASGTAVVMETSDRIRLAMAKGLLEDAGIPVYVSGEIATLVQDLDPFLHKRLSLHVPRSLEAEALQVLEQFHRPIP